MRMTRTPTAVITYGKRSLELSHRINGQLNLSIGCDFHLSFENIEAALLEPHRFTIAAKQYLLVEHE